MTKKKIKIKFLFSPQSPLPALNTEFLQSKSSLLFSQKKILHGWKRTQSKTGTKGVLFLSSQCNLYSCVEEQRGFREADASWNFRALAPHPSDLFSDHFTSLCVKCLHSNNQKKKIMRTLKKENQIRQ